MWLSKPTQSRAAAWSTIVGVLLGILIAYGFVYAGEIISGEHFLDYSLLRSLGLIGICVVVFGWWENRNLE